MKVAYIAHNRIPTEKAHGIQIMNTCSALAKHGAEVELVIPTRRNHIKVDSFVYYGIEKNFTIKKLFSFDLIRYGSLGYRIQHFSFIISTILYGLRTRADIYYSRDETALLFLRWIGKRVVWETHEGRYNPSTRLLIKRVAGIVGITKGLKDFYQEKGVPEQKIVVAHDAVDISQFNLPLSPQEARAKVGLPLNKKIVTYTGSLYLYKWKGVDVLLEAASYFGKEYVFVLVGGNEKEIAHIKEKYQNKNIMPVGHRPHKDIPFYLKASDVLVIPNKKGDIISERFTSPMKLFEYMASGVPIVASKLPSIEEVLSTRNAALVPPNDPGALAYGIKRLATDHDYTLKLRTQAFDDVRHYTWERRAQTIYSFLHSCIS